MLGGETAVRSRRALARVAQVVGRSPAALTTGDLGAGAAGLALLASYPALGAVRRSAVRRLVGKVLSLPPGPFPPGFLDGGVGVAWVIEHLQRRLGEGSLTDSSGSMDDALGALVQRPMWKGRYEVASGLCGLGLYFLERFPAGCSAEALEAIVGQLEAAAVVKDGGIGWLTPSELTRSPPEFPAGCFELSLPHGISGMALFLAGVLRRGIASGTVRGLLEGAVEGMLHEFREAATECAYPLTVTPDGKHQPSLLAWCQGDLAMASCLWLAGASAGVESWQEAALDAGERAAQVPASGRAQHGVGLCHGTAGVAHMFNRLYQQTQVPLFGDASRRWFAATLDLTEAPLPPATPVGFLNGWAGVALAFSAALTDEAPDWDRALLLSAGGSA